MSNEIIKYSIREGGFGILIMELSMLMHTGNPLVCYVPTPDHPLYALKKIYKIPDSRLTLVLEDRGWHPASNDMIKAFSPYIMPDVVNLFGQDYVPGRRGKTCIGLAMHAYGMGDDKLVKHSPYHKFATRETYDKIIKLADIAGYDVVTINQPGMSVEHKAFLLNEYCDCLIAYEGGTAHLAHTLKVPTIILPWRYHGDGSEIADPLDEINNVGHSYHMDRRTYFLKTQEEIVSWTPTQLKSIIDSLYNSQGNNRYYQPGVIVDIENLKFEGTVLNDPFSTGELYQTRDFIKKYIKNIQLH
jgi:hypothetical protein